MKDIFPLLKSYFAEESYIYSSNNNDNKFVKMKIFKYIIYSP